MDKKDYICECEIGKSVREHHTDCPHMIETFGYEREGTPLVICPFCKVQQVDAFYAEMDEDDEEESDCESCNESFLVYRENKYKFATYKLI